ncbi:unnamed protein product [Bursaphelenchus xylophilus]|uniref:(pine wood nematode) hypothetical protein n=1 Tax=Bursaphelenchus xylophilus TaxID=6326 RepID=A0A1I7SV38_BURXY|nr:unnamed protein product [Bursaphelenchus xylophilus]CAG9100855.1 unnamed protein product [Bursaphelenchus xylophilus]
MSVQSNVPAQTEEIEENQVELSTFSVYSSVFPALTVLSFLCAVVGSFYFTLSDNHYISYLPSFSDIGDLPPERCFFSFFMNTSAFFWLCTAYFIYVTLTVHLHTFMEMQATWALTIVIFNTFGLFIGVGMAIIANFQASSIGFVHKLGCGVFLLSALFYQWGYIAICFNLKPKLEPNYRPIVISRIFIALLFTLILFTRAGMTFYLSPEGNKTFVSTIRNPNVENSTMTLYLKHESSLIINHTIEWAALVTFNLFVLTFTSELDGFDVKTVGKVVEMRDTDGGPLNNMPDPLPVVPLDAPDLDSPKSPKTAQPTAN